MLNVFGKRLKQCRENKDVSQEELGNYLKVGKSTISHYETGKRKPDIETTKKIADFLGTTMDFLLGRTDNPEPLSINSKDIKGLIRLRFEKSNVPGEIKDYQVESILNSIEFLEKLEKDKNGDKK